ncbi:MAG: DNA repair protein RadC [Bacteroidota bacterium]|nr:DNA repair protein RadC [Bacteroidota bacterium]
MHSKSEENNLSIKSWAEQDRPREKLLQKGKLTLTDAELIAILLGSGTRSMSAVELAKIILKSCNNDLNALSQLSIKELMKFKGIGEAKAITIAAALELARRKSDTFTKTTDQIKTPKDAYEAIKPELLDLNLEQFWIILLSRSNRVIKKIQISSGGISGTVVDVKVILKHALEHLASGVVLYHNHPSGNLEPSNEDKQITQKIKAAAKSMDINIFDHLIFTNSGFYSFADEGIL